EVPALFNVDTLPSLHHSYSTVRAAFNADVSARFFRDVIPAIFPGGSITGAPKQAAMKLITELEKRPRGVYTGMIGFGGPDYAAFNVAIRTLEIEKSGHTRLGTGCGIVWESDPVLEEYESGLKRSFAQAAMSDFRIIESIRLAGGRFTLLARHLSRLKRAARHFAVPWNGSAVISALRKALQASTGEGPAQKIRLTVDQNGRAEALATGVVGKRRPVVLAVSDRNVYSGDVYRRFKTSERQMYDAAFKRVTGAGLADDVIFMNESGEVVETAIANILIRSHDGAFITPPQSSGALTGTLLSALETRRKGRREPIVRSRLCMADLLRARSVWTVNSVRGILRVSRIVDGDGRALRDFKRVGPT
ncbi:MAG: chorismate-binding protein, partial [Spirochaetia bacterium]|nr:chorismate-binding protein [Spirochaetia bacterium]